MDQDGQIDMKVNRYKNESISKPSSKYSNNRKLKSFVQNPSEAGNSDQPHILNLNKIMYQQLQKNEKSKSISYSKKGTNEELKKSAES